MRKLFSLLAGTLLMALPTLARAAEFAPPVEYATGKFPRSVIASDFNKDGNPDLAVVNSEDNTINILLGNVRLFGRRGDWDFHRSISTFPWLPSRRDCGH